MPVRQWCATARYSPHSPLVRRTSTSTLTPAQLAFRQTVHQYGTDLCWTPMILAKEFNRSEFARDSGAVSPLYFPSHSYHVYLTFLE